MLKITIVRNAQGARVALAGRLVGAWVQEVRRCWMEAGAGHRDQWRVDLRETTHVDGEGKALLSEMLRRGVTFEARGCLMRAVLESLMDRIDSSNGEPLSQPARGRPGF
ncbi:MAG: hypothetical protein R3B37_04125 [Nitrospira sp.]|nr:hypothetical protein [Nitrospira sp.]